MKLRESVYNFAALIQGTSFRENLEAARNRQYWKKEQIADWQLARLKLLVEYARKNTNHYSEIVSEKAIKSLEDISLIPTLPKSQIRDNPLPLVSTCIKGKTIKKTTGGSTGAPVIVTKSAQGISEELAVAWRAMEWIGISPGDRQARFWGVPHTRPARWKSQMTDALTNRIRCSAFAFSEKDLERFYAKIIKKKPAYCYGYVSMLREFSHFLTSRGLSAPSSIRALVTTAEPLTQADRLIIENAFQAKVFNEYGCGELGTIAHECPHGGLHLNSDSLIVETLDDLGNPTKPGTPGELVITDLGNWAMPLLRYRVADYGMISSRACDCGRTLSLLENVVGRSYDMLTGPNGERYHGEFILYLLEDFKRNNVSINGFRLTQKSLYDFSLEIATNSKDSANKVEQKIKDTLEEKFGKKINIKSTITEAINREASGKMRIIKSEINEQSSTD